MSNPQITATVSAQDKASATLKAIADLSRKVAKEIESVGAGGHGNALASQFGNATAAAERHLSVIQKIGHAMKNIAGAASAYAAFKAPHIAKEAVQHYLPVEREMIAMQAAGGYSNADMDKLRQQQADLAKKYGETPEHVAHAQGEFVKRHMNAATAQAMTDQSVILAKAIGTTVQNAAKILEGSIFGSGKHVDSPEDAKRLGTFYNDRLARAAKSGAMSPEDLDAFNKYGAASIASSGMSYEQGLALGMILKREQFGGDESGVFMRQLGARLMMPTNDGRIALASAGIKYDDFVKPGKIKPEALNLALSQSLGEAFGTGLSANALAAIRSKIEAGTIKDKASFVSTVANAWAAEHGDMKAADRNKLAKTTGRVYESSKGQIDGASLLDAMMSKMSPQQIMEYLGVKQGSKGASAINQLATWRDAQKQLEESEGTAQRIAEERMKGLAASIDRLSSTMDATKNAFVEANKGWLSKLSDAGTNVLSWAGGLDDNSKQIATFGGAIGGGVAAIAAMVRTWKATGALIDLATKGLPVAGGGAGGAVAGSEAAGGVLPFLATPAGAVLLAGGALGIIAAATPEAERKALTDAQNGPDLLKLNPKNVIIGNAPGLPSAFPVSGFNSERQIAAADLEQLRKLAGIEPIGASAGRFGVNGPNMPATPMQIGPGLPNMAEARPVSVDVKGEATVTGEANLIQSIKVDPSPLLIASMQGAQNALRIGLQGRADLGSSMGGSNGAKPNVGSVAGSGAFKPTVSGF